jgi:hypothetical protein
VAGRSFSHGRHADQRATIWLADRHPDVREQRAERTGIWMAAFLAVALVMIVVGVGWLAFGPPIR